MAIDFQVQSQGLGLQGMSAAFANNNSEGVLLGQRVILSNDPMSLLAECAEELTYAVDTTDDFELQERKEKESAERKNAEMVKKYQESLRQTGDTEALSNLKDSIKGRIGAEHALRFARSLYKDSSDAFAALKNAYEDLEKEGASKELLQGITDALSQMEREEGPEIRAGIYASLNADGFANLGDTDTLKTLYRTTVCNFTSVNDVFRYVQNKHGNDFEAALSFLYKTLGNDLDSGSTSVEKTKLENINNNLGEMRTLQSAYSLCNNFLDRIKQVHEITSCDYTGMDMLGRILSYKDENYLGSDNIETLIDESRIKDVEKQVLFLQELLNSSRQFAVSLFDGANNRMKVIDAIQAAVDNAIAREDAWLASQE